MGRLDRPGRPGPRQAGVGGPLDGPNQTLPALYQMPRSAFNDIIYGSNSEGSAGPGYDLVTGLGTPIANQVISFLGATNYSPTGASQENVFVTGADGNLHAKEYSPSAGWVWRNLDNPWTNLPNPGGVHFTSNPDAINYYWVAGGVTLEDVYLTGSDGNLYYDNYNPSSGAWNWYGLGSPRGVPVTGNPDAINYYWSAAGVTLENVFLRGSDGNLYYDNYNPSSGSWNWYGLGAPSGVHLTGNPDAINYYSSAAGASFENVFVTGSDGNLYDAQYNPSSGAWSWVHLNNPGGVQFASNPDAINYYYAAGGSTFEDVYLTGSDGNLYDAQFNPSSSSWSWVHLNAPVGVHLTGNPAVINYYWAAAGVTLEDVYMRGTDSNLYYDLYNPSPGSWTWYGLGAPSGVHLASNPAAITYYYAAGSETFADVYLTGSDGNLYDAQYNPSPSSWSWVALSNPGGVQFTSDPIADNYVSGGLAAADVKLAGGVADRAIAAETSTPRASLERPTAPDVLDSAIEIDFAFAGSGDVKAITNATAGDGYGALDFVLSSGWTAGRRPSRWRA